MIGGGTIEGFDEGSGQIEHDAALPPLARLDDEVSQLRGLARAGGADQHRVGLFETPGIGHPGNRVRHMEPERRSSRDGKFGDGQWIKVRMGLGQFLPKLVVVVSADLAGQHVARDQHRPALVALLEDVRADLLRQLHEPGRQWTGEEARGGHGDEDAANELGPGPGHVRVVRHIADRHRQHGVIRKGEIDHMGRIEIDQTPEVREQPHFDQLHFVLVHEEGKQEDQEQAEADEGGKDRPAQPLHHHHVA